MQRHTQKHVETAARTTVALKGNLQWQLPSLCSLVPVIPTAAAGPYGRAAPTIHHACVANKFFGHFSSSPHHPSGREEEEEPRMLIGGLPRESLGVHKEQLVQPDLVN